MKRALREALPLRGAIQLGASMAALLASLVLATPAQSTYLPSIQIGTAALIRPLDANNYYASNTTSTDGLSSLSGTPTPVPPETAELARALKYDPDLIYQYIQNNIETVWMYGLQKGAFGAEIDKSGTPFDQAELMVALLKQNPTPPAVNYVADTIVLNGTQFSNWTGVSNALAACQLLSSGGFPAKINGKTTTTCAASFTASETISTVTMAHIWVQVTIAGSHTAGCSSSDVCVFDPSYKTLTWKTGILGSALQWIPGAPLGAAMSGSYMDGSVSGAAWANALNTTTDTHGLYPLLQSYATNLLNYIQTNNLQGAQMEDIIGGAVVVPVTAPVRQPALPYADPSPPYPAHIWTPAADPARYNAIPDQYRSTLQVQGFQLVYNAACTGSDDTSMFNPTFYVDEIYGRRLSINTNFAMGKFSQGIPPFGGGYGNRYTWISYDNNSGTGYFGALQNVPPFHNAVPSSCGGGGEVQSPWGLDSHVQLTVNHPYAASADGTATTGGTYMDAMLDKPVKLVTSLSIVHGWGDVGPALLSKWSDEQAQGTALPPLEHPPFCLHGDEPCHDNYPGQTGDLDREKIGAAWLAQYTRAARLNAAIGNSVPQLHHVLGFVYGDTVLNTEHYQGPTVPYDLVVEDNFDRVDVDAGLSLTNKAADAPTRRAAIQSLAGAAAALEGSVAGQLLDAPDTSSTATRFEWGNAPPASECTAWGQNPVCMAAQRFYQFDSSSVSAAPSLVTADGHLSGSSDCPPDASSNWGSNRTPPIIGQGECQNWRGALSSILTSYANAGFTIVASREAFLGPGQRPGVIIPQDIQGGFPGQYGHEPTKQRGGAFVATSYDANGDLVQIAHIIIGSPETFGSLILKGGGGGSQPNTATAYDPANAADVLKSQFVDRSNLFGVNLANGSLGYTSPVSLTIGNGGFPYALSAQFSWKPTPTHVFQPKAPVSPSPDWPMSWQNNVTLSGSGLEAMGQSDIRGAAQAIAAFAAAQDIYKAAASPQREAAAVLAQAWWSDQIFGNVATVSVGSESRQFVKIATGQWILPGTGYATLAQTGTRLPIEEKCQNVYPYPLPYAVTRGWDYTVNTNVSVTATNAHGDPQTFSPFKQAYYTDEIHTCGNLKGFRLTSWTFPYGVTVTPEYGSPYDPVNGTGYIERLIDVKNSIGRQLDFSYVASNSPTLAGVTNHLTGADARSISLASDRSSMTDAMSQVTSFNYLSLAQSATQRPLAYQLLNLVYTADSSTANVEYDYDSVGRVKQIKDATSLRYNARPPYTFYLADGTRGERDDPLGQAYTVVYDGYGHPAHYIDEVGNKTDALFDSRSRPVHYVYPENDCEVFAYDDHNNTTDRWRVDTASNCSTTAGAAHVLHANATYHQTWNKPTSVVNARRYKTTLTYYASGSGKSLLHTATRPAITEGTPVYTFAYTAIGKLDTATGPTGILTKDNYDSAGNLTSTILDSGGLNLTTAFGYDPQGDVSSTTDPRNFVTTSLHDLDRRNTEDDYHTGSATAALNAAEKVQYDAVGRDIEDDSGLTFSGTSVLTWQMTKQTGYTPTSKVASVTDADYRATNNTYDDADRLLTVSDPLSRKTHFAYCAPGDANCAANQVKTEYRAWVAGSGCTRSGSLQQCYRRVSYGGDSEQRSLEDANNNTTTYVYDGFIRLTDTQFPDYSTNPGDYEHLGLDANGNVTSRRNRAGETLTYQYNALDWIIQKCMPSAGGSCPANPAVTTSWTYLLDGRINVLSDDATNKVNYGYDTAGRLTAVDNHINGFGSDRTVNYALDAAGNRTQLSWPTNDGAYSVGYCYDNLNRMTVAMENSTDPVCATNLLATYTYDTLSRRTNVAYGNGASMAYTYSPAGDLWTLNHDMNGASNDPHYTFQYTNAHELYTEADTDPDYVWQPAGTATTTYAAANNLNQYPSSTGSLGTIPFGYDAKGNLSGYGLQGFTYDAENRLLTATAPGLSAAYAYDPLGRRNHKSGTGVTETYFLDDGDDEIAEYDSSKTLTVFYIPGPAIDEPIAMVTASTGAKEYFHTNHQGSVIAMSDATGAKVEGPYTYDPYGNCFSGAGVACSAGEPYRFTGRRFDPETGLLYFRARYYAPDDAHGSRFLQTDPIGYTADLNLYTYVGNDPVGRIDPLGLYTYTCDTGSRIGCAQGFQTNQEKTEIKLQNASERLGNAIKDVRAVAAKQAAGDTSASVSSETAQTEKSFTAVYGAQSDIAAAMSTVQTGLNEAVAGLQGTNPATNASGDALTTMQKGSAIIQSVPGSHQITMNPTGWNSITTTQRQWSLGHDALHAEANWHDYRGPNNERYYRWQQGGNSPLGVPSPANLTNPESSMCFVFGGC